MHISIMCINSIQNIKAVAPKLSEEIAGQTMYLYPNERTDRGILISHPPTIRRGSIQKGMNFFESSSLKLLGQFELSFA